MEMNTYNDARSEPFSKVSRHAWPLSFMLLAASLLLTPVTANSGWFSSNPPWTAADKSNFCHFLYSQSAGQSAQAIVDAPGSRIPDAQMNQAIAYYKQALREARSLEDSVLDKIHPDLRTHYREEYQRSYELKLESIRQGNMQHMLDAKSLYNRWVDWVNSAKHSFRIPKGTVAGCRR
jgi:hypothetical protein